MAAESNSRRLSYAPLSFNTAMPHRIPWDGREPITEAMERYGLRNEFQVTLDRGDRTAAERILCEVGADEETAFAMMRVLIPDDGGEAQ
jgi:hypothetical protein